MNGKFAKTVQRQKCFQSPLFCLSDENTALHFACKSFLAESDVGDLFRFWGRNRKHKCAEILAKREDLDVNIKDKWHSKRNFCFWNLIKKVGNAIWNWILQQTFKKFQSLFDFKSFLKFSLHWFLIFPRKCAELQNEWEICKDFATAKMFAISVVLFEQWIHSAPFCM